MFSFKAFLLFFTTLRAYRVNSQMMKKWANSYTREVNLSFKNNAMVTGLYGKLHRFHKDRIWKFHYGKASTPSGPVRCGDPRFRSGLLNAFGKPFSFSCPANYAISGFYSRFDRRYRDRQWAIRCCKISNARLEDKSFTEDLNFAGGGLNFKCALDAVLVGLKSAFSFSRKDRVWQAQCARLAAENAIVLTSQLSGWLNDWDHQLMFGGEPNLAITGLYSVHQNGVEDRRWKLRFGPTVGSALRKKGQSSNKQLLCLKKQWTVWQNQFHQLLDFTCPSGRLLNGIVSYHDNTREDRRWKFHCCELSSGFSVRQLPWSNLLNKGDGVVDFQCKRSDQAIIGLLSWYDRGTKDRMWKAKCGLLIRHDRQL